MSIRVYYKPGCSSCAKTKELLSCWGVAFEAINVEENEPAMAELARRGLRMVPVVTDGDRQFHGWNPEGLARFVGIDFCPSPALPRDELITRLNRILLAAQRAIAAVPEPLLERKVPNRDRSLRDLAYHLFRLGLAYRDALETGSFPSSWLEETPPPSARTAAALAQYGENVRKRLEDWFAAGDLPNTLVETYYGPQSAAALLERTVWHVAQHLRQLYALMEGGGLAPSDPLPAEDFSGLSLPESLW